MADKLKFYKDRQNVEIIRINKHDPLHGDSNIDPSTLTKIELIVGDVVIASPAEITWEGEVIQIKPTLEHLSLLNRQTFSELVIYKDGESKTIAGLYVVVANIG